MKLIYGRRLATAVLQAQKSAARPFRTTHNLFQKEKTSRYLYHKVEHLAYFWCVKEVANTFSKFYFSNRRITLQKPVRVHFFSSITNLRQETTLFFIPNLGAAVTLSFLLYHLCCYPLYKKKPSFKKKHGVI